MKSTPSLNNCLYNFSVRPLPCAAFSALTILTVGLYDCFILGKYSAIAFLPTLPTISPINNILIECSSSHKNSLIHIGLY